MVACFHECLAMRRRLNAGKSFHPHRTYEAVSVSVLSRALVSVRLGAALYRPSLGIPPGTSDNFVLAYLIGY
jgi:hypothetical protein